MRVRVAALVMHEGRVLLVDTKGGARGYVVPPGGGIEAGETPAEAVCREVLEEAGLRVEAGRMLAYRELRTRQGLGLDLYFAAHLAPGEKPDGVSGEDRRLHWVARDELAHLPHFPEQLADLMTMAEAGDTGAAYLGTADLTGIGR